MKAKLLHTPYDGSSKPFAIGLKPLEPAQWLSIDSDLERYIGEKEQRARDMPDKIIAFEADSTPGQDEVCELVAGFITANFPETYRRVPGGIEIVPLGRIVALDDPAFPAIHNAARLIQEDLVLMRKGDNGWRLAAASLCFPSSWNLREKFGKPMHEIHAPVPGFHEGTRNASLIGRMFDNLQVTQPVVRWNWSLYGDDKLYHPVSDNGMKRRFGEANEPAGIHLRLERQTLRKLPQTGDIVFTIRIFVDPLEALETHDDAASLASSIATQISAMSDTEISYKGLADERDRLLQRLNHLAGVALP